MVDEQISAIFRGNIVEAHKPTADEQVKKTAAISKDIYL
jgi:hypothetical protein